MRRPSDPATATRRRMTARAHAQGSFFGRRKGHKLRSIRPT